MPYRIMCKRFLEPPAGGSKNRLHIIRYGIDKMQVAESYVNEQLDHLEIVAGGWAGMGFASGSFCKNFGGKRKIGCGCWANHRRPSSSLPHRRLGGHPTPHTQKKK